MNKFIEGFIKDQMYKYVVTISQGLLFRKNDLYLVALCCKKGSFFYYRNRRGTAMSGDLQKSARYNLNEEQLLQLIFFCEELIKKSNR